MIEGKLNELGHDPRNVQVIVQGDSDDSPLYLVSDVGIIKNIEKAPSVPDAAAESRDTIEGLRSALCEANQARDELQAVVDDKTTELAELRRTTSEEINRLRKALQKAEQKATRFWKLQCEQMLVHEEEMEAKETEISSLRGQLIVLQPTRVTLPSPSVASGTRDSASVHEELLDDSPRRETVGLSHGRKGKAPPVDAFTGESLDVMWEDWIPTLERWNGWSDEEKLMQLAGHLRGKAQQEWALLPEDQKRTFAKAAK